MSAFFEPRPSYYAAHGFVKIGPRKSTVTHPRNLCTASDGQKEDCPALPRLSSFSAIPMFISSRSQRFPRSRNYPFTLRAPSQDRSTDPDRRDIFQNICPTGCETFQRQSFVGLFTRVSRIFGIFFRHEIAKTQSVV